MFSKDFNILLEDEATFGEIFELKKNYKYR